jgi:outer membrane lipopolysaccharide assembly protein LptE/RlpB
MKTGALCRLACLLLVLPALTGCGYSLVGRGTSLPEDIHTIYVQTLANRTARAQVDQILTQAIIDEFVTRRRFEIVRSGSEADAVMSGTVMAFNVRPVTFAREGNTSGRATEYEIIITANMEFRRTDTGDILWHQSSYQFRESYQVDVSEVNYYNRENEALEKVAGKFAESLIIDVLEGF